jgi:ectoine hydroxylase-related dioxygenase (phytanoyl-CoA dioxygenase family)
MRLTPHQIKEFFETGYFLLPDLFTPDEVRKMQQSFDRLQNLAGSVSSTQMLEGAQFVVEGKRIDRVVWCGGADSYLLGLGADARLTEPASQLLESRTMEQLINQAHFKLGGDGVLYEWHQDSEKRRYGTIEWNDVNGKGSFVQTITAVDENSIDNGPLYVWPGSSKLGHLNLDEPNESTPTIDESKLIPMLMKPGSTLFLHPYTVHGSRPNNSNRSRRVFINGYASPGANKRKYPGAQAGRLITVP